MRLLNKSQIFCSQLTDCYNCTVLGGFVNQCEWTAAGCEKINPNSLTNKVSKYEYYKLIQLQLVG